MTQGRCRPLRKSPYQLRSASTAQPVGVPCRQPVATSPENSLLPPGTLCEEGGTSPAPPRQPRRPPTGWAGVSLGSLHIEKSAETVYLGKQARDVFSGVSNEVVVLLARPRHLDVLIPRLNHAAPARVASSLDPRTPRSRCRPVTSSTNLVQFLLGHELCHHRFGFGTVGVNRSSARFGVMPHIVPQGRCQGRQGRCHHFAGRYINYVSASTCQPVGVLCRQPVATWTENSLLPPATLCSPGTSPGLAQRVAPLWAESRPGFTARPQRRVLI